MDGKLPFIAGPGNIDYINGVCIIRCMAADGGGYPSNMGSVSWILNCAAVDGKLIYYGVQVAVSFSGTNIAVRNASYNSTGQASWGSWVYIHA